MKTLNNSEKIKELYLLGYSYGKIAKELNVSKGSIPGVLKRLGVYNRNRKSTVFLCKEYDDQTIIQLYQEGKSCGTIGERFSISRAAVRSRLLVHNIPLRQKKGLKHSKRKAKISLEFFKEKIHQRKEDFDYFLGIFASDGNIYKNTIRIGGISDENVEFLQHWCDYLDNKVHIHRTLRSNKKSYQNIVAFKNQDIADLLYTYGITPNKTFTLQLPYINWNIIRGLFDGDGCLIKDKRCLAFQFDIVTASIIFAEQLENFFKSENLKVHLYCDKTRSNPLYYVTIMRQQDIYYIYEHLYKNATYFLHRKYDKFCPLVEKFTNNRPVNSVKEESNLLD